MDHGYTPAPPWVAGMPRFYWDKVFLLALLAGGGFWGVLWLTTPVAPLSWQQVASWWFVSLALWQPCWEELLFRGVLQGSARRYAWGRRSWWGISGANVATALLFALAHWWAHAPLGRRCTVAGVPLWHYARPVRQRVPGHNTAYVLPHRLFLAHRPTHLRRVQNAGL
jgi:membrane protease YdiL (CAAX protease family)